MRREKKKIGLETQAKIDYESKVRREKLKSCICAYCQMVRMLGK